MAKIDDLENETQSPISINLYGVCGKFSIPNSNLRVRYFSTFASSNKEESHHHELLKMLKPMRELTEPSKINDLRTLLQRDLSDKRVGSDLIPYLTNSEGEPNHVAFFPAILCVLMPQGFITEGSDIKYPEYDSKNSEKLDYGNWTIEFYGETPLAKLTIFERETDIIVLDGQHRANAFRVISKSFDTTSAKNNIYSPFYRDVEKDIPREYDSDLPVTIMWFEEVENESEKIKPEYISRKLFIDVNQNAQKVSKSRNILLDDKDPSALFTNTFYTFLASQNSFESCSLSLLHSGFDYNKELGRAKDFSSLSLFVPEIIHNALDWLFFGSDRFMDLDRYKVSREYIRKNLTPYEMYFEETYFEVITDADDNEKKIVREQYLDEAKAYFTEHLAPTFYQLFSEFCVYDVHIKSSCELQDRFDKKEGDWKTELRREVWTKLFKGGEGLLYVYKDHKKTSEVEDYVNSINNIDEEFYEIRSKKIKADKKDVNSFYDSITTYAFIVGYLQAFHTYYSENKLNKLEDCSHEFIERMNQRDVKDWIYIINEVKPALEKRTDPKKWPTYRNIILRYIMKDGEFYDEGDLKNETPDANIFKNILSYKLDSYTEDKFNKRLKECYPHEIEDEIINSRSESAFHETRELIYKLDDVFKIEFDYKEMAHIYVKENTLTDD